MKVSVAALPLVDAEGKETEAGQAVSENLTSALVAKKVVVVERSLIKSVLKELVIQDSDLVDPATAQRLGRQIGASTVLTGKIIADGNDSKVNVRLISVETGQVLLAALQTAKGGAAGEAGGAVATVNAKGLASIRFDESMGYTIMPEMKPGVSTHNNSNQPMVDIPKPLLGKPFTQVVANHGGTVHIHFVTAGKVYVLGEVGYDPKEMAKVAKREDLPNMTWSQSGGRDWEVWSITAEAGKEFDITVSPMLVAGKLEKGK